MPRLLTTIMILLLTLLSCQEREPNNTLDQETTSVKETSQTNIPTSPPNAPDTYAGVDFTKLPMSREMLDMWDTAEFDPLEEYEPYQYRNSTFKIDNFARANHDYIKEYGLSAEERKVVGYWFALDGIQQTDLGISFMDALRKSVYPRLAIFPNGFFICKWDDNGPVIGDKDDAIEGELTGISFRGKWKVRNNKLFLQYYQYIIYHKGFSQQYLTLSTPFELELIDLDNISPDNFSTKPFAALAQPPEVLERLSTDLRFITEPAYYVRSFYYHYQDEITGALGTSSPIFGIAASFISQKAANNFDIDEFLTSTDPFYLDREWYD